IDCRGFACPAPVLKTKEAVETRGLNELTVIVDNEAARQNVGRFLESRNFEVLAQVEEGNFHIIGRRKEGMDSKGVMDKNPGAAEKKIMVMIASDRMGHGDDELGSKLIVSFLKTLKEMGDELWRLVFVNNGVKLTLSGSEVLPVLKELEEGKIHILVCGTCLTHFNMLDKKQVGETTNMLDIVTAMQLADKVINI
ncbi:MAG: sulfurtransferase-like selenium metabolism protein YedF, partial [Spirochaetales bacterium]|nr:sulfurtransferase-like selenium metabolism protein YedF [Spirochaetales bacterium]